MSDPHHPALSSPGSDQQAHHQNHHHHHQQQQQQHITILLESAPTSDNDQLISVNNAGQTTYQLTPAIPDDLDNHSPTLAQPSSDHHYHHNHQHHNNNNNTNSNNIQIINHDHIQQQPQILHSVEQEHLAQNEQQQQRQSSPATRFKWTKEKSQVAMNLVKYGCKPKLISVAVGCSLRTAQKFVETVTPKMEGESFKTYEIRRRGRKSKDVNQRLNAIREVLSKDCTKTQVEIAADLKVSNTTVCRDLKRIGAAWRDKGRTGVVEGNNDLSDKKEGQSVTVKSNNNNGNINDMNTRTRGRQKRKGQRSKKQANVTVDGTNNQDSTKLTINLNEPNASVKNRA